ncbi:MAG: thiamine ABC transporter substrate binding subunit [Paracoccaceae bacterium]|nr:thiamine ABC transporter substrate binding subunit [Paracoccaceae bacterium]
MRPFLLLAGLFLAGAAAAEDKPVLTVYAPDYFGSEWGPGPGIEAGFEAICGCDLAFRTGDVLPRLLLEGDNTRADVAIGLNTDVTLRAREAGIFAPHGQDTAGLSLPVDWADETFLPFNWSYAAFVYDRTRLAAPPESFADLLEAEDLSIVIQDPRSSISGLALLLWVEAVYGEEAGRAWERLAPKVLTVTQDWSTSYGLFTEGEADMVLSFTTSPAYHIVAEEDDTKAAAIFEDGHYLFVELAAKVAGTDQPELADLFMDYVLSREFQAMIPTTNWSYPARLDEADWPQAFRDLPRPGAALFFSEEEAEALRRPAVESWRRAFSR